MLKKKKAFTGRNKATWASLWRSLPVHLLNVVTLAARVLPFFVTKSATISTRYLFTLTDILHHAGAVTTWLHRARMCRVVVAGSISEVEHSLFLCFWLYLLLMHDWELAQGVLFWKLVEFSKATPVSDCLPSSMCSVLLTLLHIFRAESRCWDASEMHCSTSGEVSSIILDGCDQPEHNTAVPGGGCRSACT